MCGYGSCGVSCASGVEGEGAVLQGRETSSPASACLGEEEDPWCRLKRHRFGFFFFMNSTWNNVFLPKHVISFKRKWRQNVSIPNQSFNLCAFSILVPGFRFLQSSLSLAIQLQYLYNYALDLIQSTLKKYNLTPEL